MCRPVDSAYNALGAADYSVEVLDLLKKNIETNSSVLAESTITVGPLLWDNQEHIEQVNELCLFCN